jgi:serine/threonine protein kinase
VKDSQEKVLFNYLNWKVSVHENGSKPPGPDWQKEFVNLIKVLQNPQTILKHDHRSVVGTFTVGSVKYVVKKFTLQGTKLWFRLTSLLFPALGDISCRKSINLISDGILTPEPVLLMQQTRNHVVVESWLVYRYLDGQSLTSLDAAEIVSFIKQMHINGWVHRDPHPANFIRTENGVATLDPIRVKKTKSRYLRAYDVVLMEHDMPSARDLYGKSELGFWFPFAVIGHNLVRSYRLSKYGIRHLLGISNSR